MHTEEIQAAMMAPADRPPTSPGQSFPCDAVPALYHHRGERAYACIHTPANRLKGEKRTCPRSAWQVWEETHTHTPSSEFLIVIASSTSLISPKSSQQQRDPRHRNHCSCRCGAAQEQEALLCAMKRRQGCDCSL